MTEPPLPQGPRPGDRHTAFFEDPLTDHLLRAVVTLAGELSVTRDRLGALEAVLARAGVVDPAAVDGHVPAPDEAALRAAARERLVGDLLGPLVDGLGRTG